MSQYEWKPSYEYTPINNRTVYELKGMESPEHKEEVKESEASLKSLEYATGFILAYAMVKTGIAGWIVDKIVFLLDLIPVLV